MEKEIVILSRVVANHLFLGQFEALRASLLSLRKRNPELALAILRAVVSQGGRIDGVLWSSTCSSPSQLAWLSTLELIKFHQSASTWRFDPEILGVKVEFLLLIQLLSSKVSEILKNRSQDPDVDEKGETTDVNKDPVQILNKILGFGVWRLKGDAERDVEVLHEGSSVSEDELRGLWRIFLDNAEVLDALCVNIQRQARPSQPCESELAISIRTEAMGSLSSTVEELEVLGRIQQSVQMAHLDALTEAADRDDWDGAFSHLRFLHQDFGVEEIEYKLFL
ncbi:uncharacterized protein [Elaeis guineensis]|uniref:uncharacterized protein n=1 Tax=Elaeis guineensis var. tenera TaxID=51953 RepID=UPI003C6DAB0D